jgi:hypothetical protein
MIGRKDLNPRRSIISELLGGEPCRDDRALAGEIRVGAVHVGQHAHAYRLVLREDGTGRYHRSSRGGQQVSAGNSHDALRVVGGQRLVDAGRCRARGDDYPRPRSHSFVLSLPNFRKCANSLFSFSYRYHMAAPAEDHWSSVRLAATSTAGRCQPGSHIAHLLQWGHWAEVLSCCTPPAQGPSLLRSQRGPPTCWMTFRPLRTVKHSAQGTISPGIPPGKSSLPKRETNGRHWPTSMDPSPPGRTRVKWRLGSVML